METFAEWLQEELDNRSWKQADLAREAGVSPQAINRAIRDYRQRPPDKVLQGIARAFGYPVEELFTRAGRLPGKRHSPNIEWVNRIRDAAMNLPEDDLKEIFAIVVLKSEKQRK